MGGHPPHIATPNHTNSRGASRFSARSPAAGGDHLPHGAPASHGSPTVVNVDSFWKGAQHAVGVAQVVDRGEAGGGRRGDCDVERVELRAVSVATGGSGRILALRVSK